ncbi:MAG: GNAT family N-acetyltransferase [Nitrospirota bacterium]|nr:GNAT family N-acetyltransferase [Nitrospirota bacterium]
MKKYRIVKADIEKNRDDLLPVLKRNLKDISEERYVWNYTASPHGQAHCWLASEEDSGRCVGSGSLFPRRIYVLGKAVYGAIAGDFAVDREHRAYGPALGLQRTIQSAHKDNGLEFIYGVPNKLSEPIFLRIGYSELGKYNRYIKILKAEYKLRHYLPPAPVARIFSGIIDLGLKGFSRESRYRRPRNVSIEMPVFFDERFDLLWKKALSQFKIAGERNSEALSWRYKESPHHDYSIFAFIDHEQYIHGYIVYYTENNACYIADVLFVDAESIGDSLFAEFILYMRREGIGSISIRYLGGGMLTRQLKNFGFFLVKEEDSSMLVYSDKTSPLTPYLLQGDNWYFLEGDLDI